MIENKSSAEKLARDAEENFRAIVAKELEVIERRRAFLKRPSLHTPPGDDDTEKADAPAPARKERKKKVVAVTPPLNVTGLALSGGGIRSASFCLGVIQSLHEYKCLDRIDYLSTVSGGGYIGTAMTAMTTTLNGEFMLGASTGERAEGTRPPDVKDTTAVGHLRNYSNYLIPFGGRDVMTALAIILRGLVANGATVLTFVLLFAGLTILGSPKRSQLFEANVFGIKIPLLDWLSGTRFGLTLVFSILGLVLFFGWGIWRSIRSKPRLREDQSEFRTKAPMFASYYLVLVAAFFLFDLQPFAIEGMFDLVDRAREKGNADYSLITLIFQGLVAVATPLAAAVTVFRKQIEALLGSVTASSAVSTKILAAAASAAVWIGGAALPLLIWVGYLHLCYWGILNDAEPNGAKASAPSAIHATVQIKGPGLDLSGTIDCRPSAGNNCGTKAADEEPHEPNGHAPLWLTRMADGLFWFLREGTWREWFEDRKVMLAYFLLGLLLFSLSLRLNRNANSLHRLYRDRLSKAFLFDPTKDDEKQHVTTGGRDFEPLNTMKLSELVPEKPDRYVPPYHLLNAALNVQGSDFANRRGRNADFFLFSPLYIGSDATGYADTTAMEERTNLDLPTVMAISGAAFSPNAGAASIRPLTATLALLNIRTGYWLHNPRFIANPDQTPAHWFWNSFYLLSEIIGKLYEDSKHVFLSDGGHIENLGLYQLLRRRCRLIVVVDAEADPAMRFPSFIALQRYARIDLGVRINMPWDKIQKTTTAWMGFTEPKPASDKKPTDEPRKPALGPHVSIGTIDYDGGAKGWLVYIKASLTGDENDYVRDYGRRYDKFPHESTGDQFFSEEQFEVYRALGFHITSRFLNATDNLQVFDDEKGSVDVKIGAQHPNVIPVYAALRR